MEIKEIKAIVDIMKRSALTEFQIEEKDFKLRICRKNEEIQTVFQGTTPPPFPVAAHPFPVAPAVEPVPVAAVEKPVDESKLIKSPMVGTYYTAPSPDSPDFIKIGDSVTEDSVVCIVEAMKVMNEIPAGVTGKIVEALIGNGDNVEYGQPLFRIQ